MKRRNFFSALAKAAAAVALGRKIKSRPLTPAEEEANWNAVQTAPICIARCYDDAYWEALRGCSLTRTSIRPLTPEDFLATAKQEEARHG